MVGLILTIITLLGFKYALCEKFVRKKQANFMYNSALPSSVFVTMDVEDVKSKPFSVEVPGHILHRRIMLQHNSAVFASLPLDTKPETDKDTNMNQESCVTVEYAHTTDLSRLL